MRGRLSGVLVGTAVGDSLGLPAEGLSPARARALRFQPWRHRFFMGYGVVSDDTEHAGLVALSLLEHPREAGAFGRALLGRLRLWFACLPPGVGLATARACIKMWFGFGLRSGVFSAGNGPAMRSPLIGAFFANDEPRRREFVQVSTQLTHTDPQALWAALALAECAALEASGQFERGLLRQRLDAISDDAGWSALVAALFEHLANERSVAEYAGSLGLARRGVSGFALHSVPVALYAWLRHRPDVETALTAVLDCGGDTDSVGAMVGAVAGAALGVGGFPARWVRPIRDWPFGVPRLITLGESLESDVRPRRTTLWWPLMAVRNMVMLLVVLAHGFRRLLPPYAPARSR